MFKFPIPVGAVLTVKSPTGGDQSMVHAGNGVFISDLPPLMMPGYGVAPETKTRVDWVSITLEQAPPVTHVFDAAGAAEAVKEAASLGDVEAGLMLRRMERLDDVIAAPTGIIMPPGRA